MTSSKYIGLDVHKESISIAVRNAAGCNAWVVKQIASGFTRRNLPLWEKAISTNETTVQVVTFNNTIAHGVYPSKLPLIPLWQ